MPCRIAVSKLSKRYRQAADLRSVLGAIARGLPTQQDKIALDDISFEVNEGERVGVVGENGAGKSTLMHILAGVAEPTHGRADISGRVHAALTVGLGLRETCTGRENLYLDGEVQGKSRAEVDAMLDKMIAFAELGDFIDWPVHTYSSGMKARLAFTSLVFIEPEILIVDEALGVGDIQFARKAAGVVRELCNKGRIAIIVSHSLEAIEELCTRCIGLHEGKIRADGAAADVTAAYRLHIRNQEEAELLAKFSSDSASWARDEATAISALSVHSAETGEARAVLIPGEKFVLRATIEMRRGVSGPGLLLDVERLDGLKLLQSRCPSDALQGTSSAQKRNVTARLPMMPLGTGVFKVELVLTEDGARIATRAAVIKVVSDRQTVGGTPALNVPVKISSGLLA